MSSCEVRSNLGQNIFLIGALSRSIVGAAALALGAGCGIPPHPPSPVSLIGEFRSEMGPETVAERLKALGHAPVSTTRTKTGARWDWVRTSGFLDCGVRGQFVGAFENGRLYGTGFYIRAVDIDRYLACIGAAGRIQGAVLNGRLEWSDGAYRILVKEDVGEMWLVHYMDQPLMEYLTKVGGVDSE